MKSRIISTFLTGFLLAGVLTPMAALSQGLEGPLPEGPGMQTVLQACTPCHGLANITDPHKQLTAEEWEYYFYDMVSRGAAIYPEDLETVKQYLIDSFAVDG